MRQELRAQNAVGGSLIFPAKPFFPPVHYATSFLYSLVLLIVQQNFTYSSFICKRFFPVQLSMGKRPFQVEQVKEGACLKALA